MLFESYIKNNVETFKAKVESISQKLGINPDWLMMVMYAESRINPAKLNNASGASGLIQFMPATARGLGTTVEYLRTLSNVAQLDWVYKYFSKYAGKIQSAYDLYKITFFPISLGKPQNWVFESSTLSASKIAAQNPTTDINKDGKITIAEFEQYVDKKFLAAGVSNPRYYATYNPNNSLNKGNILGVDKRVLFASLAGACVFFS
ncbi:MAG: transglycosylase SLT domain-containing protein [Prevotellaceae bacterium]|jgi:hypothetical protein|nr:transglycosylase SLT domain-containing protein [Prevotellaceae bacterium]